MYLRFTYVRKNVYAHKHTLLYYLVVHLHPTGITPRVGKPLPGTSTRSCGCKKRKCCRRPYFVAAIPAHPGTGHATVAVAMDSVAV